MTLVHQEVIEHVKYHLQTLKWNQLNQVNTKTIIKGTMHTVTVK